MTRKNILITGASAGLGAGMAREFAARGRNLALCARRTDRLEALREELLAQHPGITVAVRALDVNDHDAVFEVFNRFAEDLGRLDRVIVNAGVVGKGASLGTGHFRANVQAAQTNFVAALVQAEAALELFRPQGDGHLVLMSSVSAVRGLPGGLTAYGAGKAGVAALAEGVRADLIGTPIKVTTLLPGYIRTEPNATKDTRLIIDAEKGCRLLAKAIEREPARAIVPAWPWIPIGMAMRHLPLRVVAKLA